MPSERRRSKTTHENSDEDDTEEKKQPTAAASHHHAEDGHRKKRASASENDGDDGTEERHGSKKHHHRHHSSSEEEKSSRSSSEERSERQKKKSASAAPAASASPDPKPPTAGAAGSPGPANSAPTGPPATKMAYPPPPLTVSDPKYSLSEEDEAAVEAETSAAVDRAKKYRSEVEKTAKYTRKWVPRFLSFQNRVVSYAMAEQSQPKASIEIKRVVRGAEKHLDPLSIIVSGVNTKDQKPTEIIFRLKTRKDFEIWYRRLYNVLVMYEGEEPLNSAIPKAHPKTHLKFVEIPLEYLHVFAPLDRLLLHFFALTTSVTKNIQGKDEYQTQVVFIGDRLLYCCRLDANITRCIQMKDIAKVVTGVGMSDRGKMMVVGVQCNMPEFDICFVLPEKEGELFCEVLRAIYAYVANTPQQLEFQRVDSWEKVLSSLQQLFPSEFYKLAITLPMSKKYLCRAMLEWSRRGSMPPVCANSFSYAPRVNGLVHTVSAPVSAASPKSMAAILADSNIPVAKLERQQSTVGANNTPKLTPAANRRILLPPGKDKLQRLLMFVGLPQYYSALSGSGVDWEQFCCMDAQDLARHGITSSDHQIVVQNALDDTALMNALNDESAASNPPPMPDSSARPRAATSAVLPSSLGAAKVNVPQINVPDDLDIDLAPPKPKPNPVPLANGHANGTSPTPGFRIPPAPKNAPAVAIPAAEDDDDL